MNPTQDPLVEFNLENLGELQKRLMKDWPRSIVVVKWLETRILWYQREPTKYPIYILSPGGNIDEGLVMYGDLENRSYYLTFYNFQTDVSSLKSALLQTKKIDWSRKMLCATPAELTWWMSEIVETLGYQIEEVDVVGSYLLPADKAEATTVGLPEDVHLARLGPEDIPEINSMWPYRFEWSEDYLCDTIRLNYGYGLVNEGKMVAWALKYEYGDIGVLHTLEEYRKRGLAKALMKFFAAVMSSNREEVYVLVADGNVASETLMKGLGFERVNSYNWIHYKEK